MRSWRNWHTHDVEVVGFVGSTPTERTNFDVRSSG